MARLHLQHCNIFVELLFGTSVDFFYETTDDICKFRRNYCVLLFHNSTFRLLASTSEPCDRNTCAEVTAFTPTCDTSPTSEPHETHQHTHTSGRSEYICSSRLFHLHHSHTMSACVCVRACVLVLVYVVSITALYSRCWTVWNFHILHSIQSHRVYAAYRHCCSRTHTYTQIACLSVLFQYRQAASM